MYIVICYAFAKESAGGRPFMISDSVASALGTVAAHSAILMGSPSIDKCVLQIRRVVDRDWNLWHYAMTPEWRHDGHDNNWLLLEFLLALPFAIGYKTEVVACAGCYHDSRGPHLLEFSGLLAELVRLSLLIPCRYYLVELLQGGSVVPSGALESKRLNTGCKTHS